jgi:hypothetical protein
MSFGFILTRHVNSQQTNRYWNQSVKLLKKFYPYRRIVIIDDNSNPEFLKADHEYSDVFIIQSEYPGSGEILPYIYFLRNPSWFRNAVIIHDSIFFHARIAFEKLNEPVLPLWNFEYDKENLYNILRICGGLKNNYKLMNYLSNNEPTILGMNNISGNNFVCCFGVQSYINHKFLCKLEDKYGFTNLVHYVKNRADRCATERIMGLLFSLEYPKLNKVKSLLGNIHITGNMGYNFQQYQNDFKNKNIKNPIIKVWTGR